MKICVISSGSKGNMTYIENDETRILIDCGITLKNGQTRLNNINESIDITKITDLLITHEHGDHIKYLDTVQKKTNCNVYMSKKSFDGTPSQFQTKLCGRTIFFIEGLAQYKIGTLNVYTLPLSHDCKEVFGYIIEDKEKRVGYITDTGIVLDKYINVLSTLDAIIIEANHNVDMLLSSDRDYRLKQRVVGTNGHLSNESCCEILSKIYSDKLKYIFLAHISEDCNNIECITKEIIEKFNSERFIITSQLNSTKVIEI